MRVFDVQVMAQRDELQRQVRDLQACASPDREESALAEKVNTLSKRCQHLEVLSQRVHTCKVLFIHSAYTPGHHSVIEPSLLAPAVLLSEAQSSEPQTFRLQWN